MYGTRNFESDKEMNDKSVVSDDNEQEEQHKEPYNVEAYDNKQEEQHKEPYNVEAKNIEKKKCSESNDFEFDHKKIKVDQTYDYLPQGIFFSNFPFAILFTC